MVNVQSIDTSGLQMLITQLQGALMGTGGDCAEIVKDESRRLAMECGNVAGPRNRAKKMASIPGEVGRVFASVSPRQIAFNRKKSKIGSMVWLGAGVNYLTGVKPENYLPNLSSMDEMYRKFIKTPNLSMGKKFRKIGTHGKQSVQEINRIMVKRGVLKQFIAHIVSHLGRMKASWFATAKKIDPSLVAPQWIERHIAANPKARTDLTGLANAENPSTFFGSTAIGITKFVPDISRAVATREKKVAARIKLVLSGYAKDVAAGIKIKRHAKESHAQ